MKRVRLLGHGLLLAMLLSSAGLTAPACAAAHDTAAATHAHHDTMTTPGPADAGDCCERCDALCGALGCAAFAGVAASTEAAIPSVRANAAAQPSGYLSPSPHSPFRPPIDL